MGEENFRVDAEQTDGADCGLGEIVFYIHGGVVEFKGQFFPAGELTADLLNLTPEEFETLQGIRRRMERQALAYEKTQDRSTWWRLNNLFLELREGLMRYRVFQLLLHDDSFLNEAQQYTEFRSLFPEKDLDFDDYTLDQLIAMEEQTRTTGSIPVPLLITLGGRKEKWNYYRLQMKRYDRYLDQVAVFNPTVHNFINYVLSKLEHNSPENYAAALHFFYNDAGDKLIVNPKTSGQPFYQRYDDCALNFVPRELPDGRMAIFQQISARDLQLFLKADFTAGLNAGHNIRRCLVCKRYFLVRTGVHALYCEGACPHAPQYTCRQFGTAEVQKELAKDIPKIRVKLTAFERIRKDQQRGIITDEEARLLKDKARDLLFDSLDKPDVSASSLELGLSSKHLYRLCGVNRRNRPKGRPRKSKDGGAP